VKIRNINIELKIIKLDLERISFRLEDNNRSIKDILKSGAIQERAQDLKELIEFNRFLLQKHKERIADKLQSEDRLKSFVTEETMEEVKMLEEEKRMENFILTIDKSIEFNSSHPYYLDSEFINDLMNEFLKNEDYERCASLKKHLEEISMDIV
jgi:hypothetical protein